MAFSAATESSAQMFEKFSSKGAAADAILLLRSVAKAFVFAQLSAGVSSFNRSIANAFFISFDSIIQKEKSQNKHLAEVQ